MHGPVSKALDVGDQNTRLVDFAITQVLHGAIPNSSKKVRFYDLASIPDFYCQRHCLACNLRELKASG